MRIFIVALFIFFSLQSWARADDIREFQIEGMSIGDSALDYFSEKEMEKFYPVYYPASNKFAGFEVPIGNIATKSFKTYETISFHFKK